MKNLFLLTGLVAASGWSSMLVRVAAPARALPGWVDIAGSKPGLGTDVIVDDAGLARIDALGMRTEIIIPDVDRYLRAMAVNYRSLAQVESFIDSLATTYPGIVKKVALGTTAEGRTVWALKISKNVDLEEDEPTLLFMGLHHAREWPTVEICLFLADTLTRGYGRDSTITAVVDGRQVWVIPCVNPDGYYYCHDLGNDWRKNRRYFPATHTFGVDLNRNYNTSSDGVDAGQWGSINSGNTTHFPDYEAYCGPSPFSEAETRAVRDFVAARDIVFSVAYHTYSELVMWPWGYSETAVTPDNAVISAVGQAMAARITTEDGKGQYLPVQAVGLYPTTGDSDDWLYGFFHYHLGRSILPFTIEACSEFEPSPGKLNQIVHENFDAQLYLCAVADSIRNLLTPRVITTFEPGADSSAGTVNLAWQANEKSRPSHFEVDRLEGAEVATDSVEPGSIEPGSAWVMNRFTVSSKSKHSGASSYHSFETGSNRAGSMTTALPVYVEPGDSLTCWVNYDIEKDYDYGSVEVSTDGRDWTVLEGFNGSSGWTRKAYSLEAWAHGSVFIRFRYSVDEATNGGGLFVDDIRPVARYRAITVLSDDIAGTTLSTPASERGSYFFRARGYNSRGWGDFSQLKRVVVATAVAERKPTTDYGFRFTVRTLSGPDRTEVRYTLPEAGPVRLAVFDPAGRIVAVPIDRPQPAGIHNQELKLTLPAGVYFLRFETPNHSATGKVLVVR